MASAGPSLDEAFRLHARYLAFIVLRLVGRGEEVEDLVHDVFLEAARSLERLRNPNAVKAYLTTIAVRRAQRHLLRRRLRAALGLDADYD